MHPHLYRALLTVAFTFIILALIPLPILDPGDPAYTADVLGLLLLVFFILAITWEYRRQQRSI